MADNNKKKYIKYEDITYILEDHRLPDPNAEDNGKVLGVVNGEYALKQEEGGSGAVTSVNGKTGAVTLSASDVGALPDSTVIPAAVTEQDVAGWGFTKNTGTYTKPSGGIPASDLADDMPFFTLPEGGQSGQALLSDGADGAVWGQAQGGGSGLTNDIKQALLDCFENVAWINEDGQDYYDALYAALYPPKTVISISAAFNQGSAVIYDTDSLDTLKQYLTVTALYDDTSTGIVTNYTLSGTLTEGTSTITVLYNGKTTTFTVNVTAPAALASISAVFTQGSAVIYDTDSLDTLKQYLTVTATMSDSTTRTVTDYTLSGTLSVGTSTITVTYTEDGITKTTTFTVNVTADARKSDMNGWTAEIPYTNLEIVENSYVNSQHGDINSYNGWNRTGYVPCDGVLVLNIPPMPTAENYAKNNWFYDENRIAVSNMDSAIGLNKNAYTYIPVPSTARYFILSAEAAVLASCVNEGIIPSTEPTNWSDGVPYSDVEVVTNSYVEENGTITAYNGWDRTVFIPCYGANRIKFPAMPQSTAAKYNCFYNLRRNKVQSFTLNRDQETIVTVPSGAAWFAISSERAALATLLSGDIIPYSTSE